MFLYKIDNGYNNLFFSIIKILFIYFLYLYYNYKNATYITNGWKAEEDGWITLYNDNSSGTQSRWANYMAGMMDLQTSTNYKIVVEIAELENTQLTFIQGGRNDEQFTSRFIIPLNSQTGTYIETRTTKDNFKDLNNYGISKKVDYLLEKSEFYGYSGDRIKALVFCSRKEEAKDFLKKLSECETK